MSDKQPSTGRRINTVVAAFFKNARVNGFETVETTMDGAGNVIIRAGKSQTVLSGEIVFKEGRPNDFDKDFG